MPIDLLNPDGLPQPEVYRQVAVATGSRTVYLAGQVARTAGSFADIAKLTIYVVDWTHDKLSALGDGIGRAAARLGIDPVRPITLIGVTALAEPDLLVEVEATAVLP